MKTEEKNMNFFSRVKTAVVNLENYNVFLGEKISVAIKYFFLIVLILVLVIAVAQTYSIMGMVNKGVQYIQNEMPDFLYQDGKLEFSENVNAYDEQFDVYMIADTSDELSEEKINEYKDQIKSSGIIFLKDNLIYKVGNQEVKYNYSELSSELEITDLNKEKMLQYISSVGMIGIAITIVLGIVFGMYIVQVISIFMDWVMITLFTLISSRICGMSINYKSAFNISIYALTLPIILTMLYNVAYYLFDFYIEYFRTVYLLISYVYIVAVILMIKSDLIKQHIEVSKIVEVQKEVHEELQNPENSNEEKEEEPKEDKKEENDDVVGEPDGSEI